jgi:LPXTG-site transpeptidase (sortase) family protein
VAYVLAQYAGMYREQKQLQQQWAAQQQPASAQTTQRASEEDRLTRLLIPKISLDAVVVEGISNRDLMKGPGHIRNTAYPGEKGNVVFSAHRDTFFRHIYELKTGDVIEVQRNGQHFRYAVFGKKIVDPNDVSVIRPSKDARLTLITCYPTYFIGPAPERLVVFAKLLPDAPNETAQAQSQSTAQ